MPFPQLAPYVVNLNKQFLLFLFGWLALLSNFFMNLFEYEFTYRPLDGESHELAAALELSGINELIDNQSILGGQPYRRHFRAHSLTCITY